MSSVKSPFCLIKVIAGVVFCLALLLVGGTLAQANSASAFVPEVGSPTPLLPAAGQVVIIPTFSWLPAPGAVKYEVQVGPQSDPNAIYWTNSTDKTAQLTLTPVQALENGALYWRVRGYDDQNNPGPWSERVFFTKYIPAPTLLAPLNHVALPEPTFQWSPVTGATYYRLETSLAPTFTGQVKAFTTYELTLAPVDQLPNGVTYWRVCGVDAEGHLGEWSATGVFTRRIPPPQPVSPAEGAVVVIPTVAWQAVAGAASYQVGFSQSAVFATGVYTYTTANLQFTPLDALADGKWYWRVQGVDAQGNKGALSIVSSFTKKMGTPQLLTPLAGAAVTVPTFSWVPQPGAARYKLEIAAVASFTPILRTYTTANPQLTPADAPLAAGTYFWRVTALDAENHAGTPSSAQAYTLAAARGERDEVSAEAPEPVLPGDGEVLTADPNFYWTAYPGAYDYRLRVYTDQAMTNAYDTITTRYPAYTPYTGKQVYVNGTYYWKVEARSSGGAVLATSAARSFTRQQPLALISPAHGAALAADPSFSWEPVVGAHHYYLRVSTDPNLSSLYDYATVDYPAFTTTPESYRTVLPNGTYYWAVEARTSGGAVITTSAVRSFTRQQPLELSGPPNGSELAVDPLFTWQPPAGRAALAGLHHFYIKVSEEADMSPAYDYATVDSLAFAPYSYRKSYPGDTAPGATAFYYWQVEGLNSGGAVITSSPVWAFKKHTPVWLTLPADNTVLGGTPVFRWEPVPGAHQYYLRVSKEPDLSPLYDYATTDYPVYTPYKYRTDYPEGVYYWRVDAQNSGGTALAVSNVYVFEVNRTLPTSTPIGAPTATPTLTPSITPSPTLRPGMTPSPTALPGLPTPYPPPANMLTVGNVAVYADTFTPQVGAVHELPPLTLAAGNIRLGPANGRGATYAQVLDGTLTLNPAAGTIQGSPGSQVFFLYDDGQAAPLFQGAFTVNADTGEVYTLLNAVFQLSSLGQPCPEEEEGRGGNTLTPALSLPGRGGNGPRPGSSLAALGTGCQAGLGVDTSEPLLDFVFNVIEGTVSARAKVLAYAIEGVFPELELGFVLHHDGSVTGSVTAGSFEFEAAGVTFTVEEATFAYNTQQGGQILIGSASITLPPAFDLGAEGELTGVVLTADGLESVSGGAITVSLPDMNVPGTGGKFKLAGARITLSLEGGGKYMLNGRAEFSLPNIASKKNPGTSYSGELYAEFELDQDGLRYVLLGGTIEPGIPIGQSGLALTGLEGRVTLRPEVRVQVTGTIETQLEVPPLGPVVSGEPSIWVQLSQPYEIGISGEVKVLIFDAAQASLVLSQSSGLSGSLHISYPPYLLMGDATLHVWRAGGTFHFTGSATVTIGFQKGALGTYWGVPLPPFGAQFAQISAKVGEFCTNKACTSKTYGFKGAVDISITVDYYFGKKTITLAKYAFFLDVNGDLDYGSTLDQYRLVDQAARVPAALWTPLTPIPSPNMGEGGTALTPIPSPNMGEGGETRYTDTLTIPVGTTDLLMVGLTWKTPGRSISLPQAGGCYAAGGACTVAVIPESPKSTFFLVDPKGTAIVDKEGHLVDYPGLGYTQTLTSTVYFVENPLAGEWQAVITHLDGSEAYTLEALGRNLPPAFTAGRAAQPAGDQGGGTRGVGITWSAFDADPETSFALYYDTDQQGFDGTLIAEGLDPATGNYTWEPVGVPTGEYFIYAVVDDLRNLPVMAYFSETVRIVDAVPPAAPTGLAGELVTNPGGTARGLALCWEAPPDADVTGYIVYLGTLPGIYDLGTFDAANVTCYDLPLPARLEQVVAAVAAYDASGNFSPLSEALLLQTRPWVRVYLPLVVR